MAQIAACTGRGTDGGHCCYLSGVPCKHLVENIVGRRYACGLLIKYGSWEKMNASPEYEPVGKHWEAGNRPFNHCETFDPAFCCRPEHRHGRANDLHPLPKGVTCCGDMG